MTPRAFLIAAACAAATAVYICGELVILAVTSLHDRHREPFTMRH